MNKTLATLVLLIVYSSFAIAQIDDIKKKSNEHKDKKGENHAFAA